MQAVGNERLDSDSDEIKECAKEITNICLTIKEVETRLALMEGVLDSMIAGGEI